MVKFILPWPRAPGERDSLHLTLTSRLNVNIGASSPGTHLLVIQMDGQQLWRIHSPSATGLPRRLEGGLGAAKKVVFILKCVRTWLRSRLGQDHIWFGFLRALGPTERIIARQQKLGTIRDNVQVHSTKLM